MYTRALRTETLNQYAMVKSLLARKSCAVSNSLPLGFLRFQYPHDYTKPSVRTDFPGPQTAEALQLADTAASLGAAD